MDVLQHHWAQLLSLAAARGADLAAFATLVQSSASTGQLPELSQVPQQVLYTGGTAVALALLLLVPRGRRLLFDTADTAVATVAAIALLLVLIATLLSVPLGMLYVSYLGLQHLGASLVESYPALIRLIPQLPALMQSG
ncbi:hypothetical protein MNEG_1352 [Monoraphidium neglectum]|uniref:Uncharacterized protein n=1 Tax=Monoraphidium neglectum TaxID=145388 RepID=A0A0D2LJM0_9CHLO|nr:hypothetical protein MNEG_1352 [Monoraphidium neglectum]KIZ06599.1 hypothetical protein MNEG_1352 [Monoraphidium neglectum]|eukprot:XP_013905618.1 hypothetical protein MNEG_1352 [Monoraphidium neglectum]